MKRIPSRSKFRALATTFAFVCILSTFFSSCDKCRKVSCAQGECVDGTCVCPSGFEGEDCGTAVNAKFPGTYAVEESCTAGSDNYDLFVQVVSGSSNRIRIAGLWDQPRDTIEATVEDDGLNFTIAKQDYAGNEIEGEGSLGASLESGNIDYRIYNSGSANPFDECSLSFQ